MSELPSRMPAVIQHSYGPPLQVLTYADTAVPSPGVGEVLVQVAAAALNALDWHYATGEPMFARFVMGWGRPSRTIAGNDLSGTIVALGAGVTDWTVGEEVFASTTNGGAFAGYAAVPTSELARRPHGTSLQDASALGVAALTALQALRDWGGLREGEAVLVNGASGGVGTFAIQVAKALGAGHVTAVCSTRNVEQARALGAHRVVDYTLEDLRQVHRRYDVFLDCVGSLGIGDSRALLKPGGRYVMVSAPKSRWLKPLPRMLATPLFYLGHQRQAVIGRSAVTNAADLQTLADLASAGSIRPVIEARLALADGPAAVDRQGRFHSRGKVLLVP